MKQIKLPKPHLSWSQMDLWRRSPETYRKQYYPEKKPKIHPSPEMRFGNYVTDEMEKGNPDFDFIPRLKEFERYFEWDFEGVKVIAYLDNGTYDIPLPEFNEQKTGRTVWTQSKVDNHKQNVIYSLLVQKNLGAVNDLMRMIDVRTEKIEEVEKYEVMPGIFTEKVTSKIRVTGEVNIKERIITQEERDEMEREIIRIGHEIAEDYAALGKFY